MMETLLLSFFMSFLTVENVSSLPSKVETLQLTSFMSFSIVEKLLFGYDDSSLVPPRIKVTTTTATAIEKWN